MQTAELKADIIALLKSTQREGIESLIKWLEDCGYFTSPASTKFHGCYEGGLAAHSFNVYALLEKANKELNLNCPDESVIIAALLHDLCKVGAYLGNRKPYSYNRSHTKGHAQLSLLQIQRFIKLTDIEAAMIKYHMGVYGLKEFDQRSGEYNLRGGQMANAWHHHPIVKVMYFCDEFATLQEKASEAI